MTVTSKTLTGTRDSFIKRRPLLAFFVLSYAFFWLIMTLVILAIGLSGVKQEDIPSWIPDSIGIVGAWMPSLAATIVTLKLEGGAGVRRLFGKPLQFRQPGGVYLATVIPVVLIFAGADLYLLFGGKRSGDVNMLPGALLLFYIIQFLSGPTGEEPGWSGFALPRLLTRHSPLRAGLLLGIMWALWHIPLWPLRGGLGLDMLIYCVFFTIGAICLRVYMTWLYCRTNGSLVPMTVCHYAVNLAIGLVGPGRLGYLPAIPLIVVYCSAFVVMAIVTWVVSWRTRTEFSIS
jgi:uncharacterized protein